MNDKIFHPFFVKTHIDRNDGKIYHIYIWKNVDYFTLLYYYSEISH